MSNLDAYFRSTKPNGPLAVKVGDKVAYARYFLRQIAVSPTDSWWHRRGVVTSLESQLTNCCYVQWDDEEEPKLINVCNLAFPGPNLRFCE